MNEIHSQHELKYKKRWLTPLLRCASQEHPIVVLTGARQVGKSTLLKNESPFASWKYLTLDDYDVFTQAQRDPAALWAGADKIVLDEVQKSARLLEAVKVEVDANRGKRRFVLSGSANLLLMKQVSESLAGRAVYFALNPMTLGEMNDLPPQNMIDALFKGEFPAEGEVTSAFLDPLPLMWKGFMPSLLALETTAATLRWWEGYIATYLERDLRQLSQIDSLPDFRRVMTALALRCGKILNQTEVAHDTGISQSTVHRYINLLETTNLMERLPAYTVNRTKRLLKSPKLLWSDAGLATFLSGYFAPETLRNSPAVGGLFETVIYHHLNVLAQLITPKPRLFYWRTTTGQEVDFVLEWGRKLVAVEVKLSNKPKFADAEILRVFLNDYPEAVAGLLVHTGKEIKRLHEKIVAVPWVLLGGMGG